MSQSNQHSSSAVIDFEHNNKDDNNRGNGSNENGNRTKESEFNQNLFLLISRFSLQCLQHMKTIVSSMKCPTLNAKTEI